MGNRVARLAYTNEATAAAWAVVGKRGLTGVPATPEAEAQLFLDVSAELRRQALGMPPGLNRTSLAAAVREVGWLAGRGWGCGCMAVGARWGRWGIHGTHHDAPALHVHNLHKAAHAPAPRNSNRKAQIHSIASPTLPPQMTQGASSNPVAAAVQHRS